MRIPLGGTVQALPVKAKKPLERWEKRIQNWVHWMLITDAEVDAILAGPGYPNAHLYDEVYLGDEYY